MYGKWPLTVIFCELLTVYRGAKTEVQDINSYTPFLLAAANGHLEVVAELQAKTQIDKLDRNRKSAVFLAAEGGYLPVLKVPTLTQPFPLPQTDHCYRGIFQICIKGSSHNTGSFMMGNFK